MPLKVAFCLHGLSYGKHTVPIKQTKGRSFSLSCIPNWKEQVLDKYQANVFIHTWNPETKEELIEKLNPTGIEIEIPTPEKKKLISGNRPDVVNDPQLYGKYSRFYSMKKVLEQVEDYQSKHNFVYDCVMITRFDVMIDLRNDLNSVDLSKLYLIPKPMFKKNKFKKHTSIEAPIDYLFISNFPNIKKLSVLYDYLPENQNLHLNSHKIFSYYLKQNRDLELDVLPLAWVSQNFGEHLQMILDHLKKPILNS